MLAFHFMARDALISWLRRAYRIAQLSVQSNIPPAEVQGLLEERVSRRQVLHGGIAIATTLATTPSKQLQLSRPSPNRSASGSDAAVLIVGAGIAGLTAAYHLRQAGVAVDVVEATHRVGGRIRSIANASGIPTAIELGGEFLDTGHTHLRSLAETLGLEIIDLEFADAGLGLGTLFFEGNKLDLKAVIEDFLPLAKQIEQDLESLKGWDLTYRSPTPDAMRLDQISLADYLDAAPISPTLNKLLRVAYTAEHGRNPEEQSCLNLLFMIGTKAGLWQVYGVSDERYHVAGGNEQIPQRLAQTVNTSIETGTVLESLRSMSGDRYQVGLRQGQNSFERVYKQIVLTVPFTVLRHVDLRVDLPPTKRLAIDQLGYGTGTKLIAPFGERIWRTRYHSTAAVFTDLPFQSAWESTRYAPGEKAWLASLTGGDRGLALGSGSPESHAWAMTSELEAIFPGISQVKQGRALRAFWAGEPYQRGSYSCYLVGQWTKFGGVESERVGNLWFAGEHCSPGAKGYMEGGCETGRAVAASILTRREDSYS